MIQSIPVYITKVQRKTGVMTISRYPPPLPLYRQDHSAKEAAAKIQRAWREFRLWKFSYNPVYPRVIQGAFSHLHGYYPNLCATKVQSLFRGHKVRQEIPLLRMQDWILRNLVA